MLSVQTAISICIPLVTFAYTCVLLWATKTLRSGIMSALSFSNIESVFLLIFLAGTIERTDIETLRFFIYVAYSVFLVIFGIVALLKMEFVDERLGSSYPVFVVANIVMALYFNIASIAYDLPYVAYAGALLFSVVLAMRRGRWLVSLGDKFRREAQHRFGKK